MAEENKHFPVGFVYVDLKSYPVAMIKCVLSHDRLVYTLQKYGGDTFREEDELPAEESHDDIVSGFRSNRYDFLNIEYFTKFARANKWIDNELQEQKGTKEGFVRTTPELEAIVEERIRAKE